MVGKSKSDTPVLGTSELSYYHTIWPSVWLQSTGLGEFFLEPLSTWKFFLNRYFFPIIKHNW